MVLGFRGKELYASFAFGLIFLVATAAQAVELRGVVGVGMDLGGDLIMKGVYSSGKSWEVNANEGVYGNAGVLVQTGNFETQLTIGAKTGGANGSNGSVTFSSLPVDIIEFYHLDDFRFGLGATYYSNPVFKINIPGSPENGEYKFNNALGGVIQIGWAPRTSPISLWEKSRPVTMSIDFRYSFAKFTPANFTTSSFTGAKSEYAGNVAGVYLGLYF